MTWKFSLSNGILTDGAKIIHAYSGAAGQWKNNPAYTSVPDFGAIPLGRYNIGTAFDDAEHGPCVMRLTPQAGTETFNRSGFLIHGDSRTHPGNASKGCVVTEEPSGLPDREYINSSLDKELEVVE